MIIAVYIVLYCLPLLKVVVLWKLLFSRISIFVAHENEWANEIRHKESFNLKKSMKLDENWGIGAEFLKINEALNRGGGSISHLPLLLRQSP